MKRITSPTVLLLAICAWLVLGATQTASGADPIFATSAANGGRLVISRSPVLGRNVALTVRIDGEIAGTVMYMRTFDRFIAPGRRVVITVPNGLLAQSQMTLDVRAGQTYSFVARATSRAIVLNPAPPPR